MKAWLCRQRDGNYMCCLLRPTYCKIRGSKEHDWYMQPGEPLGMRHLCEAGVRALVRVELEPGGITRIDMQITEA